VTKPGRTAASVQQPTGHASGIAKQCLRLQALLRICVSSFSHSVLDVVHRERAYEPTSTPVLDPYPCTKLIQNQAFVELTLTITLLPYLARPPMNPMT
jgi:hypothetical protein